MPALEAPEDRTITTLYVGNIGENTTEDELRDHFYQFGELRSITIVSKQQCAFVQFTARSAAEQAAEKSFNKLIIGGRRLNIKWGKSQGQQQIKKDEEEEDGAAANMEPVPGLPGALPSLPEDVANNFFNLGGDGTAPPGMLPPPMMLPPPPMHQQPGGLPRGPRPGPPPGPRGAPPGGPRPGGPPPMMPPMPPRGGPPPPGVYAVESSYNDLKKFSKFALQKRLLH